MSADDVVLDIGDAAMLEPVQREAILLGDDLTRMASVMNRYQALDSALRLIRSTSRSISRWRSLVRKGIFPLTAPRQRGGGAL
ncbi:TPA: hypothetical protein QEK88_003859 [Stenotrophomonas maltophilia]|nr:hypothetical protein [Stenotrophomonas maltophilia]